MPHYHYAPVTARTSGELARSYGYPSIEACAESIPSGGKVMDVGAGRSSFGDKIARLRDDVTVVKFDYAYYGNNLRRRLENRAPKNLEHIPLDIVCGNIDKWRQTFDKGYSFWLMPHLSHETTTPARRAATNMLAMMKQTGELRVGPTRGFLHVFDCYSGLEMPSVQSEQDTTLAVDKIVSETRRSAFGRKFYLWVNTSAAAYQPRIAVEDGS